MRLGPDLISKSIGSLADTCKLRTSPSLLGAPHSIRHIHTTAMLPCACSELGLLRVALGGSDQETVVDSEADSDAERDWNRGLAQRATDPEFKDRKKKGPFVVSSALAGCPRGSIHWH